VLGVVPGKPVAGERKVNEPDDMVMVWPHLLVRHAVAAMGALLVVMILAVLFDAPLGSIANPQVTPNPEKAPWYFAALQELLAIFHPLVAGVLVPGTIVIGLSRCRTSTAAGSSSRATARSRSRRSRRSW
jgi:menaquinol-cytochrome c reductase cytochrome b/c subunit